MSTVDLDEALAELQELATAGGNPGTVAFVRAAVERVRDLHKPDGYGDCQGCGLTSYEEAIPWEFCETTAALDGPEEVTNV